MREEGRGAEGGKKGDGLSREGREVGRKWGIEGASRGDFLAQPAVIGEAFQAEGEATKFTGRMAGQKRSGKFMGTRAASKPFHTD